MKGLEPLRSGLNTAEAREYDNLQVVDAIPEIAVGTKLKLIEFDKLPDDIRMYEIALDIVEAGTLETIFADERGLEFECLACFALTNMGASGVNICHVSYELQDAIMGIMLPYAMLEYAEIETEVPETQIRKKDINYEYEFTDQDIAQKNVELNKMLTNLFEVEARKKDITSSLGTKIKGLLEEIKLIHEQIESGFEMRMATCEEIKNFEPGTVICIEIGTGNVIQERDMTDDERQMGIED